MDKRSSIESELNPALWQDENIRRHEAIRKLMMDFLKIQDMDIWDFWDFLAGDNETTLKPSLEKSVTALKEKMLNEFQEWKSLTLSNLKKEIQKL